MNDKLQQLYDLYKSKGIINTVDFNTFSTADDSQRQKLYELGRKNGLFKTTDYGTFSSAFAPVKKKEVSQSTTSDGGISSAISKMVEKVPLESSAPKNENVYTGFPGKESKEYKLDKSTGVEVWKEYSYTDYNQKTGAQKDVLDKTITDPLRVNALNKQFNTNASTNEVEQIFVGYPGKEKNEYRVKGDLWQRKEKGQSNWTTVTNEGSIKALNYEFGKTINVPTPEEALKISKNESSLSKINNTINKDLIGQDEEDAISKINKAIKGYNYLEAEEIGFGYDAIRVRNKVTGEYKDISFDNWSSDRDKEESEILKGFLSVNIGNSEYTEKYKQIQDLENKIKTAQPYKVPLIQKEINEAREELKDIDRKRKNDSRENKYKATAVFDKYAVDDINLNIAKTIVKTEDLKKKAAEYSEYATTVNEAYRNGKITEEDYKNNYAVVIENNKKEIASEINAIKQDYNDVKKDSILVDDIAGYNYQVEAQRGNVLTGTASAFLKGFEGATRFAFEGISENAGGFKEGSFKGVMSEQLAPSTVSSIYTSSEGKSTFEQIVFGLAESGGAAMAGVLSGGPEGATFGLYASSYVQLKDQMNTPEFQDVPEYQKVLLSGVYGASVALLEKYGITKGFSKNPVGKRFLNSFLSKMVKELPSDATAEVIEAYVNKNVKTLIAKKAINLTGAGVIEYSTEAGQEATDIGLKALFNGLQGKKYFETPETWGEVFSQINEAGKLGFIGGAGMQSTTIALNTAKDALTKYQLNNIENTINNEDIKNIYVLNIKDRILSGEITKAQGQKELNKLKESEGLLNKIPVNITGDSRYEAFQLISERDELQKAIEGKEAALVTPITSRITEINNRLKTISENAVQVETTGEVSVQPEARVGEEVVQGESKPQSITEEGKAEEELNAVNDRILKIEEAASRGELLEDSEPGELKRLKDRKKELETLLKPIEITIDKPVIAKNATAEVDRVKALPIEAEDGATFNLDGAKYEGVGLVVPVDSMNTTIEELTPEMVADFVEERQKMIGDAGVVKAGIYKFPNSNQVSIDLSIVVPESSREQAIEFGRLADQESLFDLATYENVKTGGTGNNPMKFTPEQHREIAKALKEGRLPNVFAQADNRKKSDNLITESTISNIAQRQTTAIGQKIVTASKLVMKALPGVKIYIHQTKAEYEDAIGEKTGDNDKGAYKDGEIHINIEGGGNIKTLFHEALHHALVVKGISSGAILDLAKELKSVISDKVLRQRLDDFVSRYTEEIDENKSEEEIEEALKEEELTKAEEYFVELGAIMAEAQQELSTTKLQQFKNLINKIAQKLGLSVIFTDSANAKNAVDFINSLTKSIRTGEEIELTNPYSFGEGVSVKPDAQMKIKKERKSEYNVDFVTKIPTRNLEDVVNKYDGRIFMIQSDATGVGYDSKGDPIYGGLGYITIKENVDGSIGFASVDDGTSKATVSRMINRYGEGTKVGVLVMIQNASSTVGNYYGAKYFGRALIQLQKKSKTNYKDIANSFIDYIKSNKKIVDELNKNKTQQKLIDLIKNPEKYNEKTFAEEFIKDTTFEARRNILESLIPVTVDVKTNKSTPYIKQSLKDIGFSRIEFLKEYGDNTLFTEDMYLGNEGGFLAAGFEIELPKKEQLDEFISKYKNNGVKHPQFNGKLPNTGESFLLDGLYPVNENFVEFSKDETLIDRDVISDEELKKVVQETFPNDSFYDDKFTSVNSDKYIPRENRTYAHLKTPNKIIFKSNLERTNPKALKTKPADVATNVARGMGFSPEKGAKQEALVEKAKTKGFSKIKRQKVDKVTSQVAGNKLFNTPLKEAENIANSYMKSLGMVYTPVEKITKLDEGLSKRIARAYDEMKDDPNNKEVKAAYEAMVKETIDQYDAIVKEGYNVEINNTEPYANSEAMINDLRVNKKMNIFSTESGFGDEPITDKQRAENLLLKDSGKKDINGQTLLVNDIFRFVHDFFGHAKLGNSFGPIGEENAWRVHSEMYSPEARKAMTSETRGQNSWVNFSGVNDAAFKKRDKARELRKEGKIDEANKLVEEVYEDMKFADQKIGLLPEFAVEENAPSKIKRQKINLTTDKDAKPGYEAALNALNETEQQREQWRKTNKVNQKQRRNPLVEQAVKNYFNEEITQEEYLETVAKNQPIKLFKQVPALPTLEEITNALDSNKVATGIIGLTKNLEDGEKVASRLDIPAYEDFDTWVVSIHDGNKEGKSIAYGQTAVLKNVDFKTFPGPAIRIAMGTQNKSTIARMFGEWINENPEAVHTRAKELMNDPAWTQVGMNPFRYSWFYDKADGMPLASADEVVQVGALVLAKNAKKVSPSDPMFETKSGKGGKIKFQRGKKITVNEMAALKDQIRLEARAARDAKGDLNAKRKMLAAAISNMVKLGKIKASQAGILIKRISSLNLDNPVIVERFANYAEKVFDRADYQKRLDDAFALRKSIRKLLNTENQAEVVGMAKEFANIDPSLVEDIDVYIEMAEKVQNAVKPSRIKGFDVIMKEAANIAMVSEFSKAELERQENIKKQELLAIHDYLEDISKDMSLKEIQDIINLLKESPEAVDNKESKVMEFLKNRFDFMSGIVETMINTGVDPMTGEDVQFDEKQSSLMKRVLNIDLNQMSTREAIKIVEGLNNFLTNQITSGLESAVSSYEGATNAQNLVDNGTKAKDVSMFFSKGAGRAYTNQLFSLPLLMERMFNGTKAALNIMTKMGLNTVINGVNLANKLHDNIITSYSKEAFYGKKGFMDQKNVFERGMLAFLKRNLIGSETMVKAEFERRARIIEQSIESLKNSGDKKLVELGEAYQEVYDKLGVDKKDLDIINSRAESMNKEAVDWWIKEWSKHYKDLSDVSLSVYNAMLGSDTNYTPDKFKKIVQTSGVIEDADSIGGIDYTDKNKTGVLIESSRPNNTPSGRYISLDFDSNNSNALKGALVDINTAAGIRQVDGFMSSKAFNSLVPNAKDRAYLVERINNYIRRAKGKRIVNKDVWNDIDSFTNFIGGLGVTQSLAGLSQTISQTGPVITNTLINAGSFIPVTSQSNAWLDKLGMAISNRGMESSSTIESADARIEANDANYAKKTIKAIEKLNKFYLKQLLVKPDIWAARSSFVTYYLQDLKNRGISTNFEWETHEPDMEAANYAQMMVDRQQNISDPLLAGEFMATEDGFKRLMRKVMLPFASFILNQKARMYNDFSTLTSRTSTAQDKKIAARSLSGLVAEMAAYHAIGATVRYMYDEIAKQIMGDEDDEEEKKRKKVNITKYPIRSFINDIISPLPVTDGIVTDGANFLLSFYEPLSNEDIRKKVKEKNNALKIKGEYDMTKEEEQEFIDNLKEKNKFQLFTDDQNARKYGILGIAFDNYSNLYETSKMAYSGEFEDDYQGRITIKKLAGDDKEYVEASLIPLYLSSLGLIPKDFSTVSNRIISRVKKRAFTENQSDKIAIVEGELKRKLRPFEIEIVNAKNKPETAIDELNFIKRNGGLTEAQSVEYIKLMDAIGSPTTGDIRKIKKGQKASQILE